MDGLEPNVNKRIETLKGLSDTRWAAHAQATKALCVNYKNILNSLINISDDDSQNALTRDESRSLANKMNRLETAFLCILWNKVLQRIQTTSTILQKVDVDLVTAVDMLRSLSDFVAGLRDQFGDAGQGNGRNTGIQVCGNSAGEEKTESR